MRTWEVKDCTTRMREYPDDDVGFLAVMYPDYLTCNNHSHVIIHVLDDLKSAIDEGSFGEGVHEGIVPFMFHSANSHVLTHAEGGQVETVLGSAFLLRKNNLSVVFCTAFLLRY